MHHRREHNENRPASVDELEVKGKVRVLNGTSYDGHVLQEFAEGLYRFARWIEWKWMFIGAMLGVAGGIGAGPILNSLTGPRNQMDPEIFATVGLAGGLMFGYMRGWGLGIKLRLEAQTALCQLQIERNTARIAEALAVRVQVGLCGCESTTSATRDTETQPVARAEPAQKSRSAVEL